MNLRRRLWFLPATFLGSVAISYLFDRYGWRAPPAWCWDP
jgi:hypothetical protein